MNKNELEAEKVKLLLDYEKIKGENLNLDMSRGKPSAEQLDLSNEMLDAVNKNSNFKIDGIDVRNYGGLEGISPVRNLMSKMLGVAPENVIVGGNSSLNMMFDVISHFMTHGSGAEPWCKQNEIKFLCPAPGYDRHFAICEHFGIKMIPVTMNPDGPDMNFIENSLAEDPQIKAIWCVPKYSNPQGISYSDAVIKRFAALKPLAADFKILWDNAYNSHDLTDSYNEILNIFDECRKNNSQEMPIAFCSTSKITFAGAGIASLACFGKTFDAIKKMYSIKTISYDKLNQLRHVAFLNDLQGLKSHMKKHSNILKPKFDLVINKLENEFNDNPIIKWQNPEGGYFVSVEVLKNCAKSVVNLCKMAGLTLTAAGATYPYGIDPDDSNIRIAPSFPTLLELDKAMELFIICVKLASLNKLLVKT